MKKRTLLICVSLVFLTSCGKQKFDIGREDPNLEIKKCTALSQKGRYAEAVECLEIFKSRFPQTAEGEEAELKIGDAYFNQHQYLLAADTYQAFVKLHPYHSQVDYAIYRTGLSYLNEAPKAIDRDQQYVVKATEQFELVIRVVPQSIYREAIARDMEIAKSRLAKRLYTIGRFYYRSGEYIACIPRFAELVQKYPQFEQTPRALYYLAKASLEVGRQENARQAVEVLIQNFPNNSWTKSAQDIYLDQVQKK